MPTTKGFYDLKREISGRGEALTGVCFYKTWWGWWGYKEVLDFIIPFILSVWLLRLLLDSKSALKL